MKYKDKSLPGVVEVDLSYRQFIHKQWLLGGWMLWCPPACWQHLLLCIPHYPPAMLCYFSKAEVWQPNVLTDWNILLLLQQQYIYTASIERQWQRGLYEENRTV